MVIKVYISGISPSKEVKKRQQRALLILDSLKVDYKAIDITEPGNEGERDRFREVCKKKDPEPIPYPPQFFNEDKYCGDWDDFFAASDDDTVLNFLGLEATKTQGETLVPPNETNGSLELKQEEPESHEDHEEPVEDSIQDETVATDEGITADLAPPSEEVKEEEEIEVEATNVPDTQPEVNVDVEVTDEEHEAVVSDQEHEADIQDEEIVKDDEEEAAEDDEEE